MKPLPDLPARPMPLSILLTLWLCMGASCGSEETAASTEPDSVSGAESPVDDWVARQRHTRNPELAARLESTAAGVEARPEDGLARCKYGWALFQAGHIEEALEELKSAVALADDEFDPHQRLGMALLRLGQHEEGSAQLERALELRAGSTDTHFILGHFYRKAGRDTESREMLERHREVALLSDLGVLANPYSMKRFLTEASFYARQDKGAQALEVLSRGIERYPSEGRMWLLRGELLTAAGDLDGARAALEEAWDLLPDEPQPALQLADIFISTDAGPIPAALRTRLDAAARRWSSVREHLEGDSSR